MNIFYWEFAPWFYWIPVPAQGAAGGLTVAVANARLALKKVAEFQVSSCDEERPGCRDEGDPDIDNYFILIIEILFRVYSLGVIIVHVKIWTSWL